VRRALVTGGAGFLGSHLVEALLARGVEVRVLDDFSTGSPENLAGAEGAETIRGDCRDAETVRKAAAGCDAVFHLAARVGVRRVLESPLATIEDNVLCTRAAAEAALEVGARLVYASTSEVYGRNERVPFRESDDLTLGPPTVGRWSYAASKILDEHYLLALHRERGLDAVTARLFNAVGPRQRADEGMVVPSFVSAALRGRPLEVHGDGSQRRCFTWVGDTVRALAMLAEEPRASGGVFNVGSREEVSIMELARMVIEETGSSSEAVTVPYERLGEGFADMGRRVPDTRRIEELTGWRAETPLREALARTAAWWRERLQASDSRA